MKNILIHLAIIFYIFSCSSAQNEKNGNYSAAPEMKVESPTVKQGYDSLTFVKMIGNKMTEESLVVVHEYRGDTIFRRAIHNGNSIPLFTLLKNGDDTYMTTSQGKVPMKIYQKDLLWSYEWPRIKSGAARESREMMTGMWNLSVWATVNNLYLLDGQVIIEYWTAVTALKPYHEYYEWFTESGDIVMQTIYTGKSSDLDSNSYFRKNIALLIERHGIKQYEE